jgi:chromosome segregation ATPase
VSIFGLQLDAGHAILLLGTLGTLVKIWLDGRNAAKKSDLDGLTVLVDNLQEEDKRLRERIARLEKRVIELTGENTTLRKQASELEKENRELRERVRQQEGQIANLLASREILAERVQELVEENRKLHEYIGELRARINKTEDEADGRE